MELEAVDGSQIVLEEKDVKKLAEEVPKRLWSSVHLPFIFLRDLRLGPGTFYIVGSEAERFVIHKLVGDVEEDFEKGVEASPYIYRPQVQELLNRFRSLVVIGFGTENLEAEL